MEKKWKLNESAPSEFIELFNGLHPLVAQLLYNRGIQNQTEAEFFFNPDYESLHDPFLFRDMKKAVDRIWLAIENKEKIIIHGDYDADGVTSAAILFKTLKFLQADVSAFIPHRELDGYGLKMENVERFALEGCKLLITVDCGITNVDEIKFLNEASVDVIVTDHHEPLEILPSAFAIIDAKTQDSGYPFRDLSGAGVAFKVVQGLLHDQEKTAPYFTSTTPDNFKKWLLDIVAIGTVADVMPLIDENRILVKWGLVVLGKTRNSGLQKLLEMIGNKKIDSFTIGFQIAPRLNAAGRMKHAKAAFDLLTAEDPIRAGELAEELQKNNETRQKMTESAVEQARQQISLIAEEQNFLFAFDPVWEAGLVGLIAGRLCDEFCRPIIVMTESQGRIIGSGRSVEGFNITQSLTTVKQFLARFGGHSQACGFTLVDMNLLEEFKMEMLKQSEAELEKLEFALNLEIDAEIELNNIDLELIKMMSLLEPYGEGNEKPLFLISNLQIVSFDALGIQSQHLRLNVRQNGPRVYKMMWFGRAQKVLNLLHAGDTIEAIVELGINEWNGRCEPEARIVDLKL
ncbi:single-stranded-DNA-specific exonuclease RecJ [Patescibacteria group bacterium]|nr:single-stranded-DNA-specific exonuclease RecJ [Patescibacteria group bacterium]